MGKYLYTQRSVCVSADLHIQVPVCIKKFIWAQLFINTAR